MENHGKGIRNNIICADISTGVKYPKYPQYPTIFLAHSPKSAKYFRYFWKMLHYMFIVHDLEEVNPQRQWTSAKEGRKEGGKKRTNPWKRRHKMRRCLNFELVILSESFVKIKQITFCLLMIVLLVWQSARGRKERREKDGAFKSNQITLVLFDSK